MTAFAPLAAELRRVDAARDLVVRMGGAEGLRVLVGAGMVTALVGRVEAGSFVKVAGVPSDDVRAAEGQGWLEGEELVGFTSYRLTRAGRARSGADRVRAVGSSRRSAIAGLLATGSLTDAEAAIAGRLAADYDAATLDPATAPDLTLDALRVARLSPGSPGGRIEGALRYLGDPDLVAVVVRVVLFREPLDVAERRAGIRRGGALPILQIALRLIGRAVYA